MIAIGILLVVFGLVILGLQLKGLADGGKHDNFFSQSASWQVTIIGIGLFVIGLMILF